MAYLLHTISLGCAVLVAASCGDSVSDDDAAVRYVAVGASDAAGVGASPLSNGYVYRIEEGLGERAGEVQLHNLGIPGAETDDMIDVELPAARELDPTVVTVWAGPNDIVNGTSVEEFTTQITELLRSLRESTSGVIAVATIPDLTKLPRFQGHPTAQVTLPRIKAYNDAIRSAARASNSALVEISEIPLTDSLVSEDDGFHPSNEGHRVLAEQFLNVIVPLLGTRSRKPQLGTF